MAERHEGLKLLGNNPNPTSIEAKDLETFPAPNGCSNVIFETKEHTSLCPKTGQPDYYELSISYIPRHRCLESKSLKLYLVGFRETGQFIEEMVVIIKNDLVEALEDPHLLVVSAKMAARGGITIEADSVHQSSATFKE